MTGDPNGDVAGELDFSAEAGLEHLPGPARGAMRRLREWLGEKRWNPTQAEAILCGYDPEWGHNTSPADMAFLPGAFRFYGVGDGTLHPDDLRDMADGIERQRADVQGLRLMTGTPKALIDKAMRGEVQIPWLTDARNDPVCRKAIPSRVAAPVEGENKQGNPSYAARLKKFPDWPEQVTFAFVLWKQRQSPRAIHDAMAAKFENVTSGIGKLILRFGKGETADSITAGLLAYRASRGDK